MARRHNTAPRRHDLVLKRIKSLSRKSLSILESRILDEDCDPNKRMTAAKLILELNNEIFQAEQTCSNGDALLA